MVARLIRCLSAVLAVLATCPRGAADSLEWTDPIDGDFSDATKWTVTSGSNTPPPDAVDTINFNEAGPYTVSFVKDQSAGLVRVSAGEVSWVSDSSTAPTFDIATGTSDLLVRGGGTLNIGSSSNPLVVEVGDLLEVAAGGGVGDGFLNVAGQGTVVDVQGASLQRIASNGNVGVVTVRDDALLTYAPGSTLGVGSSAFNATTALLEVSAGGDVSAADAVVSATDSDALGAISVRGAGSTVTQVGAASLAIGNSATSVRGGLVQVLDSGVYTTGTGAVDINGSGRLYLGPVDQNTLIDFGGGGAFTANGPITVANGGVVEIDDGTINANAGLDNSAGGALVLNTGELNISGGAFVPNGGGDFTVASDLDLTLGAASTTSVAGTLGINGSPFATVSIIDGAQATSSAGLVRGGAFPPPAPDLLPIATFTVDGVGSQWTVNGPITVGSREGEMVAFAGQMLVTGGAVVTSDSGTFGRASFGPFDHPSTPAIARVAGAGSRWSISGALTTGARQLSMVEISDHAVVQAGSAVIDNQSRFTIDGPGARLDVSGSLAARP